MFDVIDFLFSPALFVVLLTCLFLPGILLSIWKKNRKSKVGLLDRKQILLDSSVGRRLSLLPFLLIFFLSGILVIVLVLATADQISERVMESMVGTKAPGIAEGGGGIHQPKRICPAGISGSQREKIYHTRASQTGFLARRAPEDCCHSGAVFLFGAGIVAMVCHMAAWNRGIHLFIRHDRADGLSDRNQNQLRNSYLPPD